MSSSPLIGIDLGTTNSAISWLSATAHSPEQVAPELIAIDGARICPSVVSFEAGRDGPLVGTAAHNRLAYAPDETIREAKRNMGSDHLYEIRDRRLTACEVQSRVLSYLAQKARDALGMPVERAVITVPAFFAQHQRQATRRAGELAGLEVERLINEPTAAALAYHPEGGVQQVLVYDLGGGTFDVSLVRMDGTLLEVLASHGDTALGGRDFDHALAEFVLERFLESQKDVAASDLEAALRQDLGARTRLLLAAEAAKIELSENPEVTVRCEFLVEYPKGRPRHLEVAVNRREFESLIEGDLDRTLRSVERVLEDARCDAADLDEVLLVGGSTRMPAVGRLLEQHLGCSPNRGINPDECVALGAAVQAGIMHGREVGKVLVDVSPYPLAISVLELLPQPHQSCRVISPRNTPIPSRHAESFETIHPDQSEALVFVFQGDERDPRRNRCIGRISLEGLKRREGEDSPSVIVGFRTNLDGVVEVTMANPGSGRRQSGQIIVEGLGTRDMMRDFLEHCEESDVEPGPPGARSIFPAVPAGDAPLVLSTDTEERADVEVGEGRPVDEFEGLPADLHEDSKTLRRIMGQFPRLIERRAEHADELRAKVEEARDAQRSQPVDPTRVRESMDALTDLLFDLGEFF